MPNGKRFQPAAHFFCAAKSSFMKQLPFYIPAVFILATIFTVYVFYRASQRSSKLLLTVFSWLVLQSTLALTGFFTVTNHFPPRFLLLMFIPATAIVLLFSTKKGRTFAEGFNERQLTLLHSVRVVIELVLFWLFLNQEMPKLMTFEGRNVDLFSGLTAPLVYYFGFIRNKIGARTMIGWNIVCLFILLFTVSNAVLSAPTPFQKFGFDQPTVAVLYYPFVWLPGVIVPVVIFSHIVTIKILLKKMQHPIAEPLIIAA